MPPAPCPLSPVPCPLLPVSYPLSPVPCLLSLVHCPLSPVPCCLSPVSCLLSPVSCPMFLVPCPLPPVLCPLSVVPCPLYPDPHAPARTMIHIVHISLVYCQGFVTNWKGSIKLPLRDVVGLKSPGCVSSRKGKQLCPVPCPPAAFSDFPLGTIPTLFGGKSCLLVGLSRAFYGGVLCDRLHRGTAAHCTLHIVGRQTK